MLGRRTAASVAPQRLVHREAAGCSRGGGSVTTAGACRRRLPPCEQVGAGLRQQRPGGGPAGLDHPVQLVELQQPDAQRRRA